MLKREFRESHVRSNSLIWAEGPSRKLPLAPPKHRPVRVMEGKRETEFVVFPF